MQNPDDWWIEKSSAGELLFLFILLPILSLALLLLISYVITTN